MANIKIDQRTGRLYTFLADLSEGANYDVYGNVYFLRAINNFLIDTISNAMFTPDAFIVTTGATSAWSIRLVNPSYSDACMRVRRASDNAEDDFGFVDGLLDTASIATFCGASMGNVAKWYDQVGSNDGTPSAGAISQPLIYNGSSVYTTNGKPSIRFSESNHSFPTGITSTTAPWTIVMVTQWGGANGRRMWSDSTTNLGHNVSTAEDIIQDTTTGTLNTGVAPSSSQRITLDILKTGTGASTQIDNGTIYTGSTLDVVEIGSELEISPSNGFRWFGRMQEAILYDAVDQESNRSNIFNEINGYYGAY